MGDFFSGSMSGHKRHRSRSTTSRSSMYTQTTQTTTTLDSMKSSHRSNSTVTAATTMSTMDEDSSSFATRSSKGKMSRTKSMEETEDSDRDYHKRGGSTSRPQSRASARDTDLEYSDVEDDNQTLLAQSKDMGTSDHQLALQLELARQNSLIQHGSHLSMPIDIPVESTIYEGEQCPQKLFDISDDICFIEEPPYPVRPTSRLSARERTTSLPESPTKYLQSPQDSSGPYSPHSAERRPIGPRSPSPMLKSPQVQASQHDLPSMDEELALEASSSRGHSRPPSSSGHDPAETPGIKRSKRQPFFPTGNTESTPKATTSSSIPVATPIEPLSIKKKASVRTSIPSSVPVRKAQTRSSPLSRSMQRRVSPQVRKQKPGPSTSYKSEDFEQLQSLAVSTKEDVCPSIFVVSACLL